MANFYLVCGISGGGKTLLSRRIVQNNPSIEVMLDADEYYAKINGDERIRDHMYEVWRALYDDIHRYEENKTDILLTTNALTVDQRNQFVEWFPTYVKHMIWVIAPWEMCVEGNNKRRRHVPEDVLKRQWQRMEFPNAKEAGWETIAHVTNWWEEEYSVFDLKGDIRSIISLKERK